MRQRTIIGVVGGSTDVPADVTRLAREVGSAIAIRGAIVLTGGDGRSGDSKNVKDAAVYGAGGGRVISILKRGDGVRRVEKHLVVHSGMRDARNVLNGFTADVLIALRGGGGTLTEIAFAAIAGRPVIFLGGSRVHLGGSIDGMAKIAEEAVATFGDERFSSDNLQRIVQPLLHDATNDAAGIDEALERALTASRVGMLPDVPQQPGAVGAYERELQALDA